MELKYKCKRMTRQPKLYERCKLMNLFHVNLKYM